MKKYTREELIDICDKAVVPFSRWSNRDTPEAQSQVATARAYLLAGCDFEVSIDGDLKTNKRTIWVRINHYEFEEPSDFHYYYLPTIARLESAKGLDWY